jgi:hypothetical protein
MKNKFYQKANDLALSGDRFIHQFGPKDFHLEAKRLLECSDIHEMFNFKELVQETLKKNFNLHQNFGRFDFSDFPLTIARGKHCFIDIYFWRRRPTVIHNHHFSGAFICLEGVNVDSEFKFIPHKKVTKFHTLGKLVLKRTRTLGSGEAESINLLDKFIHQNHHQANLTVNLCFRTPDVENKNLSHYLFSGLKFEKDFHSLERVQRLFAFSGIDDFDPRDLNLTLVDAFNFVIFSQDSMVKHPHFIKIKKYLEQKIKKETAVNLQKLFKKHDKEVEKIESLYD